MTTEDALLAAVLAAPDDDLPRLVYADHLDERSERGDAERAEFIRVQVEISRISTVTFESEYGIVRRPLRLNESSMWAELYNRERSLFEAGERDGWFANLGLARLGLDEQTHDIERHGIVRRGFISEVHCTLADWCGGHCETCNGYGHHHRNDSHSASQVRVAWPNLICKSCDGPGRTTGIGPQIVRRHPVERVVLTDVVRPSVVVVDGTTFGAVTRESAGPLFDVAFNRAITSRVEGHAKELIAIMSAAAIAWAKSQPDPARIHTSPVSVDVTYPEADFTPLFSS